MPKEWGFLLLFLIILFACRGLKTIQQDTPLSQAENIIHKAIAKHGGKAYEQAAIAFDFRKKRYTVANSPTTFQYTRQETKEGTVIKDVLTNTGFQRNVDGQPQILTSEDQLKYSNSVNSVLYFVLLPYKLNDPAVHQHYKGLTIIQGKSYHTLEITFQQDGGGTDFDDVFYYWISKEEYTVDYLAYKFHVNKGGVRFRQATNPRIVAGIRFQDYINFKAAKDTPLDQLPAQFEKGALKKLSVIELENIQKL